MGYSRADSHPGHKKIANHFARMHHEFQSWVMQTGFVLSMWENSGNSEVFGKAKLMMHIFTVRLGDPP